MLSRVGGFGLSVKGVSRVEGRGSTSSRSLRFRSWCASSIWFRLQVQSRMVKFRVRGLRFSGSEPKFQVSGSWSKVQVSGSGYEVLPAVQKVVCLVNLVWVPGSGSEV